MKTKMNNSQHNQAGQTSGKLVARFAIVALVSLLAACSSTGGKKSNGDWWGDAPGGTNGHAVENNNGEISFDEQKSDDKPKEREVERYPGSGELINLDAARRPPLEEVSEDGEINLNFEGAPLPEVVRAILGDLLQENYVIGPGVGGEVTFSTARPIDREQLLPILDMLLRWNNAAIVRKDARYHVLPINNAIPGNLVPRTGPANKAGFQLMAVPLEFISPSEMEKVLQPYLQEGAVVSADNLRGLLVLSGTPSELQNYLNTVEIFDVDWLAGMSVAMFTLQNVEVPEIATELEAIFGDEGTSPLAGLFRFIPLERINSVMVITTKPHYLDQAEIWIERLDRGAGEGAASRLYVYAVNNLEAGILADYLLDIFGGQRSQGSQRSNRSGQLTPGIEPVTVSTFNDNAVSGDQTPSSGGGGGRSSGGFNVAGGDEEVRITAVEENNSLLIQASSSQYKNILTAIERLDVEPLQVLIEAQIIEVALNDQLEYGVNWFLSSFQATGDNSTIPGLPEGSVGDFVSGDFGGSATSTFSFLSNGGGDLVRAVVTTLDSVSDVRTLSAPTLLVRNNSQARINVGQQISVQSASFNPNGNTGGTIANTQFISTGTTLDVTPRVNPGGLVYMEVSQVVSSPGRRPEGGGNPDISNSEVVTEVAVQSGQTILIGGLITDRTTEGSSGIPFLSRIPILGGLFGSQNTENMRNELVVLITPTVVNRVDQLQRVSNELKQKFVGLRPLIQQEEQQAAENNDSE